MKIVVLDVDQSHNLRLETSLVSVSNLTTVFCRQANELLEILNPDQSLQNKLKRMEKSLIDGGVMLQKTLDGIATAKAELSEAKPESREFANLQAQVNSGEE